MRGSNGAVRSYSSRFTGVPHGSAKEWATAQEEDRTQLLDWRGDWSQEIMTERARRHVLLLLGFSGQDPVIHIALTRVFEDVYANGGSGRPRVVVVGHEPDTVTLRLLVKAGLGGQPADLGMITHVTSETSSTTAVALILLAELLALRLRPVLGPGQTTLPGALESRLAALVVAAPTMLRWSFLLRRPRPWRDYIRELTWNKRRSEGTFPSWRIQMPQRRLLRTRLAMRLAVGFRAKKPLGRRSLITASW